VTHRGPLGICSRKRLPGLGIFTENALEDRQMVMMIGPMPQKG
jgi:hypothetical protein